MEKEYTVRELLDELSWCDLDSKVILHCSYDDGHGITGGSFFEVHQEDGKVYLVSSDG